MHASCNSSRPGISVSRGEGGGRGNLRRLTISHLTLPRKSGGRQRQP